MQPTNLSMVASGLFVKLQKCELHKGRIFVCLIWSVSQAQYQGQSKHSINIEVKSGAVRRHFNTLCVRCPTQFPLWFYAPDNRLLVNNTMHMGPGEYLLSGCQKNEENHSSPVGLALSLLLLCIQEAGDRSMLSY